MRHRYRRHERFSKEIASDPTAQVVMERDRQDERDFILDCLDFVEGRLTAGARRADAERIRLLKLSNEARKRAMVGADPLNITKHTKGKAPKQKLAADPVEQIGHISRSKSAIHRLTGKNKLDPRQVMAADTYRNAFETIHSSLGGSMDFDRIRGGGGLARVPAEEAMMAVQTLKHARDLLGARSVIIIDQIVCHGQTAEQCARLVYSYREGDSIAARDINHIGRMLRESLTELSALWHPIARRQRIEGFRPSRDEIRASEEGTLSISTASYVSR